MNSLAASMIIVPFTSDAIGSSDCEELGEGWLVQPVNALSSFSYVVVGLAVVAAMVFRPVDRVRTVVYAACVAAIGIGSVMFHGPQPTGSQLAHDLPILLTAWFVVVQDARLVTDRVRRDLLWFVIGAAVATVAAAIEIGTVPPLTGAAVAVILVLEIVIARRGLRPRRDTSGRRMVAIVIGVAVLAAASWILGRSDSPLCDPDDVVQLHGVWHLLSGGVFGLWWWVAVWLPAGRRTTEGRPVPADATDR